MQSFRYYPQINESEKQQKKIVKYSYETTNRNLAAQYITDKRVQWMQDVRNEITEFFSSVKFIMGYSQLSDKTDYKDRISDVVLNIHRSGRKIQMFLNSTDDKELIRLIDEVMRNMAGAINNSEQYKEVIGNDMKQIPTLSQEILKKEWERDKRDRLSKS